jgi:hypothetical protein
MIAITITQEIKDLNPDLFKQDVGVIKQLKEIPKSLFSPTYLVGRRIELYNYQPTATHEADGFFEVVVPTYDTSIERLGALFFDVDKFTYPIEAIPQAEIDEAVVKAAKDEFKSNLEGVYAYATAPDGSEWALKVGNDGKSVSVLIP